ncbi:hypothetical protein GcM1_163014 [Golovinomyces cichoracearum]|uniref:Uncharacterized protein n=1 Tax=Golovinomyces cichoracearum TaxID=62708 RepID=A0A420J8M5_9PEZI|nr:hypothetical protein GcM1_163014 [Golovinomyces cichoracearum]
MREYRGRINRENSINRREHEVILRIVVDFYIKPLWLPIFYPHICLITLFCDFILEFVRIKTSGMRFVHFSIISFVVFLQSVATTQSLGISTESTTTLKSPVAVSQYLDKRARLDSSSNLPKEKQYRCDIDHHPKTVVDRAVEKLCNLLIKEQKGVGLFGLPRTRKISRQTTAPSQLFPKEDITKLYQIQIEKPSLARKIFCKVDLLLVFLSPHFFLDAFFILFKYLPYHVSIYTLNEISYFLQNIRTANANIRVLFR